MTSIAARKIIHIDMDAFYASVEQRDDSCLRGKPIAVGRPPDRRGVVAAASYEARRFGVRSAMSSARALRQCPDLVFVRPRFDIYREVSNQIRDIFARYTDLIEPLSLDEAYLDVSDSMHCRGSATLIADEIRTAIRDETGLTASAGVSYNKFLAKTASDIDKPDGLTVVRPEQAQALLDELPIGRFFGIGQATEQRMRKLGVTNGAELRALDLEVLRQRFGKSGIWYYEIVRGNDSREVRPNRARKSYGSETTYLTDLEERSEVTAALHSLAKEVGEGLKKRQLRGQTLTMKMKYADFVQITRSVTVDSGFAGLNDFLPFLEGLVGRSEAGDRAVRLLGLTVSNLVTIDDVQLTLL